MKRLVFVLWLLIIAFFLILTFNSTRSSVDRFAAKILCDKTIPPENERKLVKAIMQSSPDPNNKIILFQKIPRIIMQTNEKDMIPEEMAKCGQTIIDLNPEYEYIYFDDERARGYLEDHFPSRILNAYDKLKPGAYKADLFRYCFLYKNGGVYIDTGMKEIFPLRELIKTNDDFISPEDNNTKGLYNAFICCSPSHPIIKNAINMSVCNIEHDRYGRQPLDITGPTLFAKAFEKVTGEGVQPNKEYPKNIRTIKYIRTGFCNTSGEIWDGKKLFFITKYPTYHLDALWYHMSPHYSAMWKQKNVYVTEGDVRLKRHQHSLIALFKIFIKFTEKYNIEWWAAGGTLLGAVRNQNIIPWDDDIDVEVPKESIDSLLSKQDELSSLGIHVVFDDYIWRFRYIMPEKGVHSPYIDLFEVEPTSDRWQFAEKYNRERWPKSYFKNEELYPLKEYKFGSLAIKGPNKPEPFLERQYGDWKTPVKEKGHYEF